MQRAARVLPIGLLLGVGLFVVFSVAACGGDGGGKSGGPSPAYVLYLGNVIHEIDLRKPGNVLSSVTLTGLDKTESLLSIDIRPANGELYGITSQGRLVHVDYQAGTATPVATLAAGLQGSTFAMDFNPVSDLVRVVSNTGQNLRVNPQTGATAVDGNLAYAVGDVHDGTAPKLGALTHTHNYSGATSSTAFGLDVGVDELVSLLGNQGTVFSSGPLGIHASAAGMDTQLDDVTFAVLSEGGVTRLYSVDLVSGKLTLEGTVGDGTGTLVGFAIP